MNGFLVWVEATSFSIWVRESTSVWAFPGILSMHTIGMGFVAGINTILDLRLLGVAPGVPISELRRFLPVMWAGFWLNAVSGVALLIAYPTKALTNPDFYLKLAFIAAALLLFRALNARVFSKSEPYGNVRRLAGLSIFCWAGAIAAGRLLAYTYSKLMSE